MKYSEEYGKDCYIQVMDFPRICNLGRDHAYDDMKIEILRVVCDIKVNDPDWFRYLIFGFCRIYSKEYVPDQINNLCLKFIGSIADARLTVPWI